MIKKNSKSIKVFEPYLSVIDSVSVYRSIQKKDISGSSSIVKKFEDTLAKQFERQYVATVSNGSIALDLALEVLNLEPEDEVILPSFTIISCLSAVIRAGAKPVFCDVDKSTWNMTLKDVESVLTQKTKAVLLVHTYGLTSEAEEIEAFCNENNLFLIEDAAEAHEQKINNRKCGSFGEISTFSFYANKHITTGEGGCIMTNDDRIYKKILQMRNLDFIPDKRFYHENLFWNYRLSGIQASLGLSQLKKYEKIISHKIYQGMNYYKLLNNFSEHIQLPVLKNNSSINNFWVFGVVIKKDGIRDVISNKMSEIGIETRPFFYPLHLQPVLKSLNENRVFLKNSEYLGSNGLYLPMGPHINKRTQKYIIDKFKKIVLSLV